MGGVVSSVTRGVGGFLGRTFGSVAKAVGIAPQAPVAEAAPAAPAPASTTATGAAQDVDVAAQQRAAASTSNTLLTGSTGTDADKTKTSKVLLGQ